jgi:dGTPase
MRPASLAQANTVIRILRALVDYFADRPNLIPAVGLASAGLASAGLASAGLASSDGVPAGSEAAVRAAVTYVAGMTDRFACETAVGRLGWDPLQLPRSA